MESSMKPQKKKVIKRKRQKSWSSAEEDSREEGVPGGVNMLRLSLAHTLTHTERHTKPFFLTRENPLSRKTVMSLVAGCKKLSLRLCLILSLLCWLSNFLTLFSLLQ